MKLTVHHVDAFTDRVFKGNYAAVIITKQWLGDAVMLAIAAENNLSETAFVVKNESGVYDIRWFSPLAEIDFCGHATLASAFVLFEQDADLTAVTFAAKAVGELAVKRAGNNFIEMSFPLRTPQVVDDIPAALLEGLSITPSRVLKNQQAYFAVYNSEDQVRSVRQNVEQIKRLAPLDVVVTAPGDRCDFVSRYFWPANGGDEDPVTGSIHAGLAPYWGEQLNKTELNAFQASVRGGHLRCSLIEDRVLIAGQAVKYMEGTITI